MLRHRRIPARLRCGFAAYFDRGRWEDHWICEYWRPAEGRWCRVDAQLDEISQAAPCHHVRRDGRAAGPVHAGRRCMASLPYVARRSRALRPRRRLRPVVRSRQRRSRSPRDQQPRDLGVGFLAASERLPSACRRRGGAGNRSPWQRARRPRSSPALSRRGWRERRRSGAALQQIGRRRIAGHQRQALLETAAGGGDVVAGERVDAGLQQVAGQPLAARSAGALCSKTSKIVTGRVLPLTTTTSIGRMS